MTELGTEVNSLLSLIGTCTAALLVTIAVEMCLVLLLSKKAHMKMWAFACILGNVITNPFINFINIITGSGNYFVKPYIILLEIIAVFVEAIIYFLLSESAKTRCFLISLSANALSFAIGAILFIFA